MERYLIESAERWREIIPEIPFIRFPATWQIQITPPYGGAVARFRVIRPNKEIKSIYLDWYNRLGGWDGPYWEVYPYKEDVGRCNVNDTETLIKMIAQTERNKK